MENGIEVSLTHVFDWKDEDPISNCFQRKGRSIQRGGRSTCVQLTMHLSAALERSCLLAFYGERRGGQGSIELRAILALCGIALGKLRRGARQRECYDETSPRLVYIATDGPKPVQQELDVLTKSSDRSSVEDACHHTVNYVFAPSSKEMPFHLKDGGNDDTIAIPYTNKVLWRWRICLFGKIG
ncbi:hypothetical protein ACHAW6_001632 [Cyclotella cf. meneghiniana]